MAAAGVSTYTDGSYLKKTGGTWHLEDSPFKAECVLKMLARHPGLPLSTVCEIGCGAGGVLADLQKHLPATAAFTGYEISPQAHALSAQFGNERCQFILGDAFADSRNYDLVLVMDVIEHVEDCFSFLRQARRKGRFQLYHIPLDVHASAVIRGENSWESVGHIHLFTIETALKSVECCGHRVIDWFLTDGAVRTPKHLRTRALNILRRPLGKLNARLAARTLGGYSILILTQ